MQASLPGCASSDHAALSRKLLGQSTVLDYFKRTKSSPSTGKNASTTTFVGRRAESPEPSEDLKNKGARVV